MNAVSPRAARSAARIVAAAVALLAAGELLLVGAPLLSRYRGQTALLATARSQPRATSMGTAPSSALEAVLRRGVSPRARVGIQAGHWKQEELPPELARLRGATGAASGVFREVDVNLAVARELRAILVSAGIDVDILPATVPPAYLADAFISIHADGANRPSARGWKMAAPWRASPASNLLLETVSQAYGKLVGLPEDRYGITNGMKGYYAFSPQRVGHAVSPFTPCIIVETGFITVASDREVIVDHPERVARAIAIGLLGYLGRRPPPLAAHGLAAYLPPSYPAATVAVEQSVLRAWPGDDEPEVARLEQGTSVLPMQLRGEWAEVVVRGSFRSFGWLRAADLRLPG